MKKLIWNIIVVILLLIAVIGDVQTAKSSNDDNENNVQSLTSISSTGGFAVETEDVWTPTFQLCWNELINLIERNNSIEYINGNPPLADELNKQKFDKENLNPDSYYINTGKMTLDLKKQIEKDIKTKFNEKSDILDSFEFDNNPDTNNYFIYSMLIKNFPFEYAFTNIKEEPFNGIKNTDYKYFGFDSDSIIKNKQLKNIIYVFYASDNDFAFKMLNKDKTEEMIFYLTDSNKSFDDIYEELLEKNEKSADYTLKRIEEIISQNPDKYKNKDIKTEVIPFIKVPYLSINKEIKYNKELANKPIKGKYYEQDGEYWIISDTIQTIKFNMNNEGAKLKSEAAVAIAKQIAKAQPYKTVYLKNYYYMDRPFIIFLKETNKDKPYFAARINDGKYLVKAD